MMQHATNDRGMRLVANAMRALPRVAVSVALLASISLHAGVVYENQNEFLSAGDFNGDGILDVLVLDKNTGNVRVGYQDAQGNLTWSAPLTTGAESASGCAVGTFLTVGRDALAITAADLNRVNLVDLSNSNSAASPVVLTPAGLGPHSLTALVSPLGGSPAPYNSLLVASSFNPPPNERLNLLQLNAGVATSAGEFPAAGTFDRPNAFDLPVGGASLAVAIVRGTNDSLSLWQFTNSPAALAGLSNLPPGSDYAFGLFNGETLPRFLLYVPGQTNASVVQLLQTNGNFSFGPPLAVSFATAIQQVFYTASGSNGTFQINFGDHIQGLNLAAGVATFTTSYPVTAGSAFTGIAPLANGNFALLDAPVGNPLSVHAQVMHFDGTNYTQVSSGNLPAITARGTRANVWLFQGEPFVSLVPGFVESLNAPDWTIGVTGLPGSIAALTENDAGAASGLAIAPATNNLGAAPSGAAFAMPNQYRDFISIFSYAAPRAQEPVTVSISPPPGIYAGSIQVSFTTLKVQDAVFYSTGATDSWHQFSVPFTLAQDSTIKYYGTNSASSARSRLQFAAYNLGNAGLAQPPIDLTAPGSTNPIPPVINTNQIILSTEGTIFYGRRTGNAGTIWCINADGSDETYITSGARPRVSRDGRLLAFLRDGNPFSNLGNLWMRDLTTGTETLLVNNTNDIVYYDWDATGTNLIFDYNCRFYQVHSGGVPTPLTPSQVCYQYGPTVNPVNGNLAFFNIDLNGAGIYVMSPDFTTHSRINTTTGARWAEWSPDGGSLAFANGFSTFSVDGGMDLFVMKADGTQLNQITALSDQTNGFPHGAEWGADGESLVAAGTINGTNGIYVIPLTADHTSCDCDEPLVPLPVTPGAAIDFVGSVIAPATTAITNRPGLHIRLGPNVAIVYWSTNYQDYTLQSASDLGNPSWTPIGGPYFVYNGNYEYREALTSIQAHKFFQLNLTGAMAVTPPQPKLIMQSPSNQLTLSWLTNYVGYRLESSLSLTPPVNWTDLGVTTQNTNGLFYLQEPINRSRPQTFYRLTYP